MYEFQVYLSNPTCRVIVTLDTENPSEYELLEAAIEELSESLKLDTYTQV